MGLNTEERQDVKFFTGYEVEHTVCYGMFTLFVVGVQPIEEILRIADDTQPLLDESKRIKHIYFGTSQSFPNIGINDSAGWRPWEGMIKACLDAGYWCTLDLDVAQAEGLLESGLNEYHKFVTMLSVKLPYINQFNYNTTLKLDDRTWGATNPGVWTHQLHDLMSKDKYTHWDQYTQDTKL
jgi:hypothetical protein